MRTLGLIGGMSWQSTETYYRILNETVQRRRGGLHSASLLLHSLDFQGIEQLQRAGNWAEAGRQLAQSARLLEAAGAEGILLCSNTMHRVAEDVERAVEVPLLHIADATGAAVREAGIRCVGVLGTRFTMEQDFYRDRLRSRFDLEVRVPGEASRAELHRIIFEELCVGEIRADSRERCMTILGELAALGCEGGILACTELALLIQPEASALPLFDSTRLHAESAIDWALR